MRMGRDWLPRQSDCLVGLEGQVEVLSGEPPCVVGDESEADAVVANVDVWMVAGSFSKFRDVVDETHGGDEVVKLEDAHQFLGLDVPFGHGFKQGNDLLIGESGHGFLHFLLISSNRDC